MPELILNCEIAKAARHFTMRIPAEDHSMPLRHVRQRGDGSGRICQIAAVHQPVKRNDVLVHAGIGSPRIRDEWSGLLRARANPRS